jgi:hypothetical protein
MKALRINVMLILSIAGVAQSAPLQSPGLGSQTGSAPVVVRTPTGVVLVDVNGTISGKEVIDELNRVKARIQEDDAVNSGPRSLQRRGGAPQPATPGGAGERSMRGGSPAIPSQTTAAWWTNAALVARLGLTEEQKLKIEMVFERYRNTLNSRKTDLEREESLLARMLETDPMEPTRSIQSQIDKVVRARAEMERMYAAMSLEIRQAMTGAQWTQLQREVPQASLTPSVPVTPSPNTPYLRRALPSSAP